MSDLATNEIITKNNLNPRKPNAYGWKPSLPDFRDRILSFSNKELANNPNVPLVDLRDKMPPIWDQGAESSCTAHAVAAVAAYIFNEHGLKVNPSRNFIYYNTRMLENSVATDTGGTLRDAVKTLNKIGFCEENVYPYGPTTFLNMAPLTVYNIANKCKIDSYAALNVDLAHMKSALINKTPFVLGFTVYESFESANTASTGILPMPHASEKVLGGHAVPVIGFDDSKQCFIARNSWGDKWGIKGNFYAPYAYFTNPSLVGDLWTMDGLILTE